MGNVVAINTDLPLNWRIPGIFSQINLKTGSASLGNIQKRMVFFSYKLGTGSFPPNTPQQVLNLSDLNAGCGQGSDLATDVAAAWSQPGVRGVVDMWVVPIVEPSGGTAAQFKITFVSAPSASSGDLVVGSGPGATASGICDIFVGGIRTSFGIASGDLLQTISNNALAALQQNPDLQATFGNSATTTVTGTYRHKGLTGNDLPVRVNITPGIGIAASPGTLTYATVAGAAGSTALSVGAQTITQAITGGDAITLIATNLEQTINAGGYAVIAAINAQPATTGVVTLYYATDRDVRRPVASVSGAGVNTTVTNATGTAGAGTSSLTQALAILAGQKAFPIWHTRFTDSTSLGAFATHIELYANGKYQKGQCLVFGDAGAPSGIGTTMTATSPALTSSPRYFPVVLPDAAVQSSCLAARVGAIFAGDDYTARNYDGYALGTSGTVPLPLPAPASRLDPDSANIAQNAYGMTLLTVSDSNVLTILKATTSMPFNTVADPRLCDVATIRTADYLRYAQNQRLQELFFSDKGGKNIRLFGQPHTPYVVTPEQIRDACFVFLSQADSQDLIDGAEDLRSSLQVAQRINTTIVNIGTPFRPPSNIHIVQNVINLV